MAVQIERLPMKSATSKYWQCWQYWQPWQCWIGGKAAKTAKSANSAKSANGSDVAVFDSGSSLGGVFARPRWEQQQLGFEFICSRSA